MPRKRLRDQKRYQRKNPPSSPSRMNILSERIKYLNDPEDKMIEIIDVLKDFDVVPDVGNYYTFIYNAKTPRKLYDQHPLIAVLEVGSWGFIGLNFHWVGLDGSDVRNYTWPEVAGYFHKVYNEEIMTMRNIEYAKFLRK